MMLFKEKTFESLMEKCMAVAPPGIDTRQGSIFYDSCAAKCVLLADIYSELDLVIEACHVESAIGRDLDSFADDHRLKRNPATGLKCRAIFEGTVPEIGARFFVKDIFFTLKNDLDKLYPEDETLIAGGPMYLEAETLGEQGNIVEEGDAITPTVDIPGLIRAEIGEIIFFGQDEEDDESLRERVKIKIGGPSENGNKSHYKIWCEECKGVGFAKILPLCRMADGKFVSGVPNYVTGVLLTDAGRSVDEPTVKLTQDYVDPESLGLGEGVANIGAHFEAMAAIEVRLNISVKVERVDDAISINEVKKTFKELVTEHLRTEALKNVTIIHGIPQSSIIRVKQIGALLSKIETIIDYDELKLSLGDTPYLSTNVEIAPYEIAVIGDILIDDMNSLAGGAV